MFDGLSRTNDVEDGGVGDRVRGRLRLTRVCATVEELHGADVETAAVNARSLSQPVTVKHTVANGNVRVKNQLLVRFAFTKNWLSYRYVT